MAEPRYLIDASVYIFRAYFSIPSKMRSPADEPVNAVYGYLNFLLDLLHKTKATHLLVAFDESLNSSFRNDIYPDYKANRELPPPELVQQLHWCKEITQLLGLHIAVSPTHEADDLIASAMQVGGKNIIVSTDKDLCQLLQDGDEMWNFAKDKRIDIATVREEWGVAPTLFTDMQGLMGDSVDNIPGVPGIGPKAASAVISALGPLEAVYDNLEAILDLPVRGAKRIKSLLDEHRDQAFMSRELARMVTDLHVDGAPYARQAADHTALAEFCTRLGFGDRTKTRLETILR